MLLASTTAGCIGPHLSSSVALSDARNVDRVVYSCAVESARQPLTPTEMFDSINALRSGSANHVRYDGYPWTGSYTHATTWPMIMKWDNALAAKAHAAAVRLANGGVPAGKLFRHQMFGLYGARTEDMWLRGLETDEYEIVARSRVATQPDDRWHASSNGTMRLAILHQTGTGVHPYKNRLGIGKACQPSGEAWWVLLFGE